MFNGQPGKCPYEENCYEEEIIKIQDDIKELKKGLKKRIKKRIN